MNGCKLVDRFEFDNEPIRNQEVQAALADGVPLVLDDERNLPPMRKISQSELDAQSVLVGRFEKPWSEYAMDLDRSGDHFGSIRIQLFCRLLRPSGVAGVLAFHISYLGREAAGA